MIKLRPATMDDAALLLQWRNDPLTRTWSHDTNEVVMASHVAWLARLLKNPDRQLFIAEHEGVPVGNVRADFNGIEYDLSWSIAPEMRCNGFGKHMVALMVAMLDGAVHAEVKVGNIRSARVALFSGLAPCGEVDGVQHFRRAAVAKPDT